MNILPGCVDSILEHKASGCVALKIPIAYDRSLDFCEVGLDQARSSFSILVSASTTMPAKTLLPGNQKVIPSNAPDPFSNKSLTDIDTQAVKKFQDYLFFQICRIAAEEDLPIQIHTGMGQAQGTNAAQLQEAIQKSPDPRGSSCSTAAIPGPRTSACWSISSRTSRLT